MKKVTITILVAAAVALTACSTSTEKAKARQLVVAVTGEQLKELTAIKEGLTKLDKAKMGVLAAAQGNEACEAYRSFQEYERLTERLDRAGLKRSDLQELETSLQAAARKAGELGYATMVAKKSLACGVGEGRIGEAEMVKNVATLSDTYGLPRAGETKFNPAVIREAYVRAIKPQVQEALAELRNRPDSSDVLGWVGNLLRDAEEWHIAPAELGVPATVVKKLNL